MSRRVALVVLRIAALVALAVSTALLLEYVHPTAAFCGGAGGCERVKDAVGGSAALPVLGVLGFAALLAASLGGDAALALLVPAAVLGGVGGGALVVVQAFVVHAFCKLCLVVDASSIVVALAALAARRAPGGAAEEDRTMRRAWASAALVVVALPVAWSYLQGGPAARTVPAEVASLWVPGKINVVEMADFQCPFCREAHPRLKEALAPYEGRVHLVRLNMPLAMHPDARSAARAYACADDQGKGEAMADALFASGDLGPAGCRALAERVGVDLGKYDRCIAGSAVDRRIDGEMARVRAAGLEGLPTVWIGDQRLLGLTDTQKIRDALAHAAGEPSGPALSAAWMWGALAVASAAFAAFAVRRARAAAPPA